MASDSVDLAVSPIISPSTSPLPRAPLAPPSESRGGAAPDRLAAVRAPSPFAALLRGLGAEVDRGERVARAALGASRGEVAMAPADLIALQAGVYRYSEVLELAARLVDKSTSVVKTVLQNP